MTMSRSAGLGWPVLTFAIVLGCETPTGPGSPPPSPGSTFAVAGAVTSRVTGEPIAGGTVTFVGLVTRSGQISAGQYTVSDLVTGIFDVRIDGPGLVPHETHGVGVSAFGGSRTFSVLTYGTSTFGIPLDDLFYRFVHQVARVSASRESLRKWRDPPDELYVVPSDDVPEEQFNEVVTALEELAVDSVPDLWCRLIESVEVTIGPCEGSCDRDGRIVVRPNWDEGASGTLGPTFNGTRGEVTVNVFGSSTQSLLPRERLRATLLHEIYHVAFGQHLCGGSLGLNPFGFGRENCPFPDSAMANLGAPQLVLSPQDKTAACLVYHPGTVVGNTWPDVNPRPPILLAQVSGLGRLVR